MYSNSEETLPIQIFFRGGRIPGLFGGEMARLWLQEAAQFERKRNG